VTEAVVDDLEAIEVGIEHREPAATVLFQVGQPLAEAVDERRAVAQARQRVLQPDADKLIPRQRAVRDVRQRAGNADGAAVRVAHRGAAREHAPVAAVFMADAMLVLDVAGLLRHVPRQCPL